MSRQINPDNFGEFLKQLREKKNMTMGKLSTRSGVSPAMISRLESGERGTPRPKTIIKLAEALGESPETLLLAAGYDPDEIDLELEQTTKEKSLFSTRLLNLRKQRHISQVEIATELHITDSAYSGYEISRAEPSMQTLIQIADYFQVSLDYLLGRDLEKQKAKSNPLTILYTTVEHAYGLPKESIDQMAEVLQALITHHKTKKQKSE